MQAALPRHRQRTQDLCAALTEKAQILGPDAKMPSVIELCNEFKTSARTLNHALKELEQRNVLYRVHAVGIFVSPTLRPNVALIVDPLVFRGALHSPFWDLLARRAEEHAASLGENLSFHFALPSGESTNAVPVHVGLAQAIENRQVHGIIAVGLNKPAIKWLQAQNIPLVAYAASGYYNVEHDSAMMLRLGVQALKGRGCSHIGMWTPTETFHRSKEYLAQSMMRFVRESFDMFSAAMQEEGLEIEAGLVRDNRYLQRDQKESSISSEREQGYDAVQIVFGAERQPNEVWPDGLLFTNDLMAAGAAKALEKLGLKVGRDVHIATLANAGSPVLVDYEDRVIRLEFETQEVASHLFAMLETLMRGEKVAEPSVKVAPHLRYPENSKVETI